MANYASLKAAIQQVVKTNGNNEITGALLQQSLLAMVNSLGANYQYAGVATPSTNPGTPDQNIFYIASTAGTYANFGGLSLENGEIAILKYNGVWSKDSTGAASLEIVNQLGQEVGKTYIQTEPLVVSASNQTIRADFNLTNRGTFKILFDGGASNITGIKVALYKDVLSAQGIVYNSSVFGFNQQIEYSGDEFNIAIFTVYANNVLTAGNATIVINTGMAAGIASNVDAIKNNADKSLSNMFYTKGYLLSGGASYDTNGLVIRANITWSDGVTGILNKSIWDDSVLEYKRDIVSHGSQSVQYDRQYNEMGEVSKETISIN